MQSEPPHTVGIVLIGKVCQNSRQGVARHLVVQCPNALSQRADGARRIGDADEVHEELRVAVRERRVLRRESGNGTAQVLHMNFASHGRQAVRHGGKVVDDIVAEGLIVCRFPVVVMSSHRRWVLQLLPLRIRHSADVIDHRPTVCTQRRQCGLSRDRIAGPAHREHDHRPSVPGGIQERQRRSMRDHRKSAEFIRSIGRKIAKGAQGIACMFGRMDDESCEHFAQGMQLKLKTGHHTESAGTASQPPVKIRVFLRAGADKSTVRQHHAGTADIVAGETVLAHQPSRTATERESTHAGARNQAPRGRQSLDRRCPVHIAPDGAPLNCGHAQFAVDRHLA